jgi:hypothetical protein
VLSVLRRFIDSGYPFGRDLNNRLAPPDIGNDGQSRYIRDVNKKHHVHMSYERVPAARVARNAQNMKNVHERAFVVVVEKLFVLKTSRFKDGIV